MTKLSRNMSALLTSADVSATRSGFTTIDTIAAAEDDHERPLEPRPTKAHAVIDEQRADPSDDEHRDEEAVELQLERQIRRKRVPADRDEQDDEDQRRRARCRHGTTGKRIIGASPRRGRRSRRRRRERRGASTARITGARPGVAARSGRSSFAAASSSDTSWTGGPQVLEQEREADRAGHHDEEDHDRDRLRPRLDDRRLLRTQKRFRSTTRSLAGTRFERCCCSTYRSSAFAARCAIAVASAADVAVAVTSISGSVIPFSAMTGSATTSPSIGPERSISLANRVARRELRVQEREILEAIRVRRSGYPASAPARQASATSASCANRRPHGKPCCVTPSRLVLDHSSDCRYSTPSEADADHREQGQERTPGRARTTTSLRWRETTSA